MLEVYTGERTVGTKVTAKTKEEAIKILVAALDRVVNKMDPKAKCDLEVVFYKHSSQTTDN